MKELSQVKNILNQDTLVLKKIELIKESDSEILLDLKSLYESVNKSDHHFKVCLTILTAAIQQERYYFLLSRIILKSLVSRNKNIPKKARSVFQNTDYSELIDLMINQYKIIEKISEATKRKAAIFKLNHQKSIDFLVSQGIIPEIQLKKVELFLKSTKVLKKNTDKYNIRDDKVLKSKRIKK